jgi:hypothetical protein
MFTARALIVRHQRWPVLEYISNALPSSTTQQLNHHRYLTMSLNFQSTVGSSESGDLRHKLGYSNRPIEARKEAIEASMRDMKQWLNYSDELASTPTTPVPQRTHTDSFMGPPAVLIASSGSIRKKKVKMLALIPPPHLTPSSNAEHLGSVKYEPQLVTVRPQGLESFIRLAEKKSPTPMPEQERMEFVGEKQVNALEQQGIVRKLMRFFDVSVKLNAWIFNWCRD